MMILSYKKTTNPERWIIQEFTTMPAAVQFYDSIKNTLKIASIINPSTGKAMRLK